MKPDEFEQQLQNQPLRPVPPAWRAEILSQANASVAADVSRLNHHGPRSRSLLTSAATTSWWREWLWPCPQAWAGLAAVWMILLGLHLVDPSSASMTASTSAPTPETQMALAAQRREMARLLDGPVEPIAAPPRVPGPRSERLSPSKA